MSDLKCDTPRPAPPGIGKIVRFHQPRSESSLGNGALEHAAVVTRVWGVDCVNLKILPDCGPIIDRTSVPRAFHNGNQWGFTE